MTPVAIAPHLNADHKGTEFFASLEGMRGIAALGVVLYHVFWNWHLRLAPVIHQGMFFVDFFFVISGFVICHIYAARIRTWHDLGEFYLLRTARLYPLHLVTLLGVVCLMFLTRWLSTQWHAFSVIAQDPRLKGTPGDFISHLLLIQALVQHGFQFNRPSWSISTEYYTYFLFAFSVLITAGRKRLLIAVALIIVTAAGFHLWQRGGLEVASRRDRLPINPGLLRCFVGFFIGVLLQFIWQIIHVRVRALLANSWRAHLIETLCIAFVGLSVWRFSHHRAQFVTLLAFSTTILVFAVSRGWITTVLESRVFQQLGKWSYSIYLTHFIVLVIFADILRIMFQKANIVHVMAPWKLDIVTLCFVCSVLLISCVTYRWIEVPPRRWAKGFVAHRESLVTVHTVNSD